MYLGYFIPPILFVAAALVAYITIQRLLTTLDREQHTQMVLAKVFELKEGITRMSADKWSHHRSMAVAFP